MTEAISRQLDDDQLEAFDAHHVHDAMWAAMRARIAETWPGGRLHFLDVGGGNGRLGDRLLAAFPEATGVVLDRSALLLRRNRPDPRKRLVNEPVERMDHVLGGERFDLIFVNWLLHHLVHDRSAATREAQVRALAAGRRLLAPGGRLVVCENLYDGWGLDDAPGRLIYALTRSRAIAPFTRRLGANSAGCGVRFRSHASWTRLLAEAGLAVRSYEDETAKALPLPLRAALGIRRARNGVFWCADQRIAAST